MEKLKRILGILMASCFIFLIACNGDDEEPEVLPPAPTLAFEGGNAATVERGGSATAILNYNALSGLSSVTVNGTEISGLEAGSTSGSITYTIDVEEGAAFGEQTFEFVLTDEDERTISAVYTVTVIGSTVEITSNITEDTFWEAENVYILRPQGDAEGIDVESGATLTIEAGTQIYMQYEEGTSYRFKVDNGGIIDAVGTAENPIVFTTERELTGEAAPGDWTGVRIEGETGFNTGTFQYVRIEYAGFAIPNNDEVNNEALRIEEVYQPTVISHVQVYRSGNYGMEVRAGDVHLSHMVFTECEDFSFELDDTNGEGYFGTMQFIIVQSSEFDNKESRDIEWRDGATPSISNLTLIGPGFDAVDDQGDAAGYSAARIRDDADGVKIYNSIFAEIPNDGFRLDNTNNITDIEGDWVIAHSYFFRIGDDMTRDDSDPALPLPFQTDAAAYFNTFSAAETPAEAAGIGVAAFVPTSIISSTFNPTSLGANFESAPFVGAIGSTDWTIGWVKNADGTIR